MIELQRMWINQPSTLQQHHNLHGKNVLAIKTTKNCSRIWFLEGDIVSIEISNDVLSKGWVTHPSRYTDQMWETFYG